MASGAAPDRNGLTKVGRALQKHGDRAGTAFPPSSGTSDERNKQGEAVLEKILSNPNTVETPLPGGGTQFREPGQNGLGVRFNGDGSFKGFIEPGFVAP